jgi:hypothetical protein
MLGLAAVARAHGQQAGAGPWHVLPPETVAAAEQLLGVLEEPGDSDSVAMAVSAALAPGPATAAPTWAAGAWERPDGLEAIGARARSPDLIPALGDAVDQADMRKRGLAALAVALCRSIDGVEALGAKLGGEDSAALVRMARLAGALVGPGQPTRVRGSIREILTAALESDRG